MSFILDALRKSENERQQDRPPSIARIPSAVPPPRLPAWAIVTMAALGLGVVVLAGAGLMLLREPPAPAVTPAGEQVAASTPPRAAATRGAETDGDGARRQEPLSLPAPQSRTSSTSASGSPLAAAIEDDAASRRTGGDSALTTQRADTNPLAMAARTTGAASSTPPAGGRSAPAANLPAVEGVPEPYHSVAPTLGLPALTLELLAYGSRPAEQFVFINGARYAAGDSLPGGARIIAINPRGAVLLVQGRQLQLETR